MSPNHALYIFLTVWETEGAKTFFLHLLEATFVFHPFITNLVEVFPIKWGGRFVNWVIIIDSFSLFIWLVGGRGRVGSGGGEVGQIYIKFVIFEWTIEASGTIGIAEDSLSMHQVVFPDSLVVTTILIIILPVSVLDLISAILESVFFF